MLKERAGSILVVILSGELDHHEAAELRLRIDHELEKMDSPKLLLDLRDLAFMDSAGLGVFLGRYKKVLAKKGEMAIAGPPKPVMRLLEMSGFHRIMTIYTSRAEALTVMKGVKA